MGSRGIGHGGACAEHDAPPVALTQGPLPAGAVAPHPESGFCAAGRSAPPLRAAFLSITNAAAIAEAYGAVAASSLSAQLLHGVRQWLGHPLRAERVADDCLVLWVDGDATALERLLARAGRESFPVDGQACLPALHADWLDIEGDQARMLTPEESAYAHFVATPSPSAAGGWQAAADRFRADMSAASELAGALGASRVALDWQEVANAQSPGDSLCLRGTPCLVPMAEGMQALSSDIFVPALERLNLTRHLDRTMVLLTLARLDRMTRLHLSCRISPLSALDDAYWTSVFDALAQRPAMARRFTLEIGGRAALPVLESTRAFCQKLRERGVRIAVSRFGSGSDSIGLEGLQACRPDMLVLDELCILRARHSEAGRQELRDMVRTCGALVPHTVVAGVDGEQDLAHARAAGARWVCGRGVPRSPVRREAVALGRPTARRVAPLAVAAAAPEVARPHIDFWH